jgi:hypothetical protein
VQRVNSSNLSLLPSSLPPPLPNYLHPPFPRVSSSGGEEIQMVLVGKPIRVIPTKTLHISRGRATDTGQIETKASSGFLHIAGCKPS